MIEKIKITIIALLLTTNLFSQNLTNSSPDKIQSDNTISIHPDSTVYRLEKNINLELKKGDTLSAIKNLQSLAELNTHIINYNKAYDNYWQALVLAQKTNDSIRLAEIFNGIGLVYYYFGRNNEAKKYFDQSLNFRRKLIELKKISQDAITSNYLSYTQYYRNISNIELAKKYLDSAYYSHKKSTSIKNYYILFEEALLDISNNNYKTALSKVLEVRTYFKKVNPSYLIIIDTTLGDIYRELQNISLSIHYYKEAISLYNQYNAHKDSLLKIHQNLSKIYEEKQQFDLAYKHLLLAQKFYDLTYGNNNKDLLEVKDRHRQEIEKQQNLLKEKQIQELQDEERISYLQFVISVITTISLILFGLGYFKYIQNKHKSERALLEEKQKLSLRKKEEVLEMKNRELTSSALKLIEKEEFISQLSKNLSSKDFDKRQVKKMLKSFQSSPDSTWKDFEARFVSINSDFYKNLQRDFPNLTQTDLKICALVKLNFTSKDISKLLGISPESVHTSRYRLRKKLNLTRNDNLEEFINKY